MKKLLVLLVALLFGISAPAFAGTAVLSDGEMNDIHAGDWVILTDGDGNQSVEDVYVTNNTLDLEDVSQQSIKAVSNANAVDAGIAVQTNAAKIEGDTNENVSTVQSNTADITNYRPRLTTDISTKTEHVLETGLTSSHDSALDVAANTKLSHSAEAAAGSKYAGLDTLVITDQKAAASAFSAEGESEGKNDESEFTAVGASVSCENYALNYNQNQSNETWDNSKESCEFEANQRTVATENCKLDASLKETDKTETETSTNCSAGANNHIALEDESQTLIQAVSNLNAVGAGAAVQTNAAANMGVSGSLAQYNTATVVSGF